MKKKAIGIIILAIVVVGGGYAVYNHYQHKSADNVPKITTVNSKVVHAKPKDSTKVAVNKDKTTDAVHTTGKVVDKTSNNNTSNVPVNKVSSNATSTASNTSQEKSDSVQTPVVKHQNNTVQTPEITHQSNTEKTPVVVHQNNTNTVTNTVASKPVTSDSTTSGVMTIANQKLYNSNPKYKQAVTQMYNYLESKGLANNEYMISICKNPEQNKNVQTEGLMGMVSYKVTKNQTVVQQIVDNYGWIQASVGGM